MVDGRDEFSGEIPPWEMRENVGGDTGVGGSAGGNPDRGRIGLVVRPLGRERESAEENQRGSDGSRQNASILARVGEAESPLAPIPGRFQFHRALGSTGGRKGAGFR